MIFEPPKRHHAQTNATGATRSTIVALTSQAIGFFLNVGIAITLARLLAPEDFGLFGLALAVIGVLEFAKQGGLVIPVIQSETITQAQRSALFWFNAALGILLTMVAAMAAPIVGSIYDDARLAPLIAALAFGFLPSGFAAQHVALLRRDRQFTTLATCELIAVLMAGALAIGVARVGASYWALVCFQLGREVIQSVLFVALARWRPSLPKRIATVRTLLQSGRLIMMFELLSYLNFKADNLIVGWKLGPVALGFYGKAYEFLMLPINQIIAPLSGVVHSSLSRLQHEPEAYRIFLSRALLLATGLGLPLCSYLFANAHVIIVEILGPQWQPTVPIYRALAPAAASMTITCCVGWIFLSLDRARRQLWWSALTTIITLAAFVVGARWGALGVALAFSVTRVVLLIPTLMFTCSGTTVSWSGLLVTSTRPALASLLAMSASLFADTLYPVSALTLPRNLLVFAATYVLCWMLMPTGRALLRDSLWIVRRQTAHA